MRIVRIERIDGIVQRYHVRNDWPERTEREYNRRDKAWELVKDLIEPPPPPANWIVMFTISYAKETGHDRPRVLQWEAVVRGDVNKADAILAAECLIQKVTSDNVHVMTFLKCGKIGVATDRTDRDVGEAVFRKQLNMGDRIYVERHKG